jgi:hypothetical protein
VRYDWRPAFGKFGLILGGAAFVLPMFLFRVPFPTLPALQKALLCCLLLTSMGAAGDGHPVVVFPWHRLPGVLVDRVRVNGEAGRHLGSAGDGRGG